MQNKIKILVLLLSMFAAINALSQVIKAPPKKNSSNENKPVSKNPSNEQSTDNKLTLKINPNLSCKLLIDGEDKGTIAANNIKKIALKKGTYLIQAISTENQADKTEEEYIVSEVNIEKLYRIDLIKVRDVRLGKVKNETNVVVKTETGVTQKSFTDSRNGKTYKFVAIGNQKWMAENLAYKANSGCLTYKNTESFATKYGYLYNWEAAVNACPSGWHLPSDDEWKALEMYLGMSKTDADKGNWRGTDQGKKIKSNNGWNDNGNGTDSYGFSAIPAGSMYGNNPFKEAGEYTYWWTSSEYNSKIALGRTLGFDNNGVYREYHGKDYYFSIRCVRDL